MTQLSTTAFQNIPSHDNFKLPIFIKYYTFVLTTEVFYFYFFNC